jgi:hypothetical protein
MNRNAPYFLASKSALINWNGMAPEEAEHFIATAPLAEIEAATMAYGSVFDAVNKLAQSLELTKDETRQLMDEMFGRTDSTPMADSIKDKLEEAKRVNPELYKKITTGFLLDACDHVHRGWTGRNAAPFFGKKDIKDQQYQYGPSEIIGWKEVKADLLFIKPVADALGIEIDEEAMKRMYSERVLDYCKHITEIGGQGIEGVGGPGIDTVLEIIDVIDNIENGDSIILSPEIADAWEYDPKLVEQIAREVSTKGIGADEQLMQELIARGILNREDPTGLDDGPTIGG